MPSDSAALAQFPTGAPRTARTGQPPKPTATRMEEGNRGHRPPDPLEPRPVVPAALPDAPAHMSDGARALWTHFGAIVVGMKVLSTADLTVLEALCEAEAKRRELEADLAANGMFEVITTTAGDSVERARAQTTECKDVTKRVLELLREFGMTPASRPKVQMLPGAVKGGKGAGDDSEGGYFGA